MQPSAAAPARNLKLVMGSALVSSRKVPVSSRTRTNGCSIRRMNGRQQDFARTRASTKPDKPDRTHGYNSTARELCMRWWGGEAALTLRHAAETSIFALL